MARAERAARRGTPPERVRRWAAQSWREAPRARPFVGSGGEARLQHASTPGWQRRSSANAPTFPRVSAARKKCAMRCVWWLRTGPAARRSAMRATRTKEAVDSSVALDALERQSDAVGVVDETELAPLDVDREAFELAQRGRRRREREAGNGPSRAPRLLTRRAPGPDAVAGAVMARLRDHLGHAPGRRRGLSARRKGRRPGCGPTNRSLKNLIRNFRIAWRTVRDNRPHVILSTGAALAVPFFIVGRLQASAASMSRASRGSTACRSRAGWSIRFAHAFFVQWPTLTKRFRKAVHVGSVV